MTTNESPRTQAVRNALEHLGTVKAPTKRLQIIAAHLTTFPTQAEVNDFTAELRRRAGVQDISLIPTSTWTVKRWDNARLVDHLVDIDQALLLGVLEGAKKVTIDWPSVTFHWGVRLEIEHNGQDFVAYSADYRMTETYMSS